jgi:hypothetical protein
MPSTEDATEDAEDCAALALLEKGDGKLDTGAKTDEGCSCGAPYMMRAKLRFDIIASRRAIRGRFLIVHPSGGSGERRAGRAANLTTGREVRV